MTDHHEAYVANEPRTPTRLQDAITIRSKINTTASDFAESYLFVVLTSFSSVKINIST